MTATEKVTNQTVTINNQAKARQCGETPSWRNWSVLVFYSKGGFLIDTRARRYSREERKEHHNILLEDVPILSEKK